MPKKNNPALVIIDLQNDYFPGGKFPLWNTPTILENIKGVITKAQKQDIPIIIIQHIANDELGIAPFFNKHTVGANNHPEIINAVPEAKIIVKQFADGFEQTNLEQVLEELEINELLICGMMTQNCVTHTAISKKAEKYKVSILIDCCTTVNEMLHNIALHALSTRVSLKPSSGALN